MSDCTWRGKVYCDGDVVIVRIFPLTVETFYNLNPLGFVSMVVYDGLQQWQDQDGAETMEECCQRSEICSLTRHHAIVTNKHCSLAL